ncbi:MAG TPA: hypothetical protein VK624_15280 [Steroidobacteraceae bacterium]|nr:hypothetical protein [Steroidobacteraceae bacterium]
MFVVDRSALAVLLPLALLLGAAVWSNHSGGAEPAARPGAQTQRAQQDQTVAANLPSR